MSQSAQAKSARPSPDQLDPVDLRKINGGGNNFPIFVMLQFGGNSHGSIPLQSSRKY